MTPSHYTDSTNGPRVAIMSSDGVCYTGGVPYVMVSMTNGVRPVISLKSDALQYSATSNGTMQYPFILK